MSIPELVQTAALLRHSALMDYWQASFGGEPAMVRRFHPPSLWPPLRRVLATADFVRSMQLQKAIAGQSPRWQAVLSIEAASMDEAWSVAADAPCSVHQLILLHVTPEPLEMQRLVGDIIQALQDARTTAGRTHGCLSAEKILLTSRTIRDAHVMACEPSPSGTLDGTVSADLRALGQIICEILTGRFWSPATPLDPSHEEFKKCGSTWRQWMAFTRDLLTLEHTADSLDQFAARVPALKPRKSRAPLAYAAVVVLLLIGGAAFLYLRHEREMARLARFNGAWPVYVHNYNSWFRAFVKDGALLKSNPLFAPIARQMQTRPVLNPNNILHEFTALLSSAKIQHDLAQSPRASRRFGIAVVLLMRSEHALAKVRQQFSKAGAVWLKNGWNAPAAQLKSSLLARLKPDAAMQPFLKLHAAPWTKTGDVDYVAVNTRRDADAWMHDLLSAQRVEAHYQSLEKSLSVLAGNPHRLVATFPSYAVNYLKRCQSIGELGTSVMLLASEAHRAQDDLRRYASRLQWPQIKARAKPTLATLPNRYFPNWLNYCSIPRAQNAFLLNQTALTAMAQSIRVDINHAQRLPKPPTVDYAGALNRITAALATVAEPDDWIEKNRAQIIKTVATAKRSLASLHSQVVAFIDSQINLKKWVAQFIGYDGSHRHYPVNARALKPFRIEAVNQLFQSRLKYIVLGAQARRALPWGANGQTYQFLLGSLRSRRWEVPDINTRVAALKASLVHLTHTQFGIPHITPPPKIGQSILTRLLTGTLIPAQMAAIEVACRLGRFGSHEIFKPPSRVITRWHRQLAAFHQLLNVADTLESRLEAVARFNTSAAHGQSIAAMYGQLKKNLWWSNPTVLSVTAPVRKTLAMANKLRGGSVTALSAIEPTIADYPRKWQPFLVRTAWDRTESFPLGPHGQVLKLERHLARTLDADALSGMIQKTHPHRADHLVAGLRQRWQQRLNQAGPVDLVPAVVSASDAYGVTVKKIRTLADLTGFRHLSAPARFNLLWFTLTRQAVGINNPQQAKKLAGQYAAVLRAALTHQAYRLWKTLPQYGRLVNALQAVLKANPAKASEPSGPALAGWHEQKLSSTQRLFVDPGGKRRLRFSLVHMSGGHSFFLCDEELRVGIFLHTIHSSDNILRRPASAFFNLIKYNADYLGPHTWVYSRRTDDIAVAPAWFTNTNQIYAAPRFPASIATSAGQLRASSGGNPTRHSPVQYLPPKAAIYLAALLGCRLPAPAQWQAAYKQSQTTTAGAALPQRGLAAYVAYLRREDSTADARLPTPPFWDIFGDSATALRPYRNDYGKGGSQRIFFRPINSAVTNPVFADLAGNVAEYVFNGGTPYQRQLKLWYKTPKTLTVQSVNALLSAQAMKKVYVIGGSALTPLGKIAPDAPVSINWATRRAKRGFSDVGIRLAYSRRVLTPQQLLARLIRQNNYCRRAS